MYDLFFSSGTGHSLMVLAFVIGIGLLLAKIKVKGVSFGSAWILAVGILFSVLGVRTDALFLHFLKEFGLILFVFSIGLQVGPAFFHSFRKDGLRFTLLALLLVLVAVGCVFAIQAATGSDLPSLVGSMTGAVTNTPGLGTAQQTYYDTVHGTFLAEVHQPVVSSRIANAFAVAYPIGVIAILFVIVLLRILFRVDTKAERIRMDDGVDTDKAVITRTFIAENPAIIGLTLDQVSGMVGGDFAVSSVERGKELLPVTDNPVLAAGDRVTIDLNARDEPRLCIVFGGESPGETARASRRPGALVSERLVITKSSLNGKRLGEMETAKHHVTVVRIIRSGVNLVARDNLRLQLGDTLKVIGTKEDLADFAEYVGNSSTALETPNLIPIFIGIGLGIVFGAIPLKFPGLPHPARLGIAGGTLLTAILIGHFGPRWKITTYTTASANRMLREVGLALLLATVGLSAGGSFTESFRLFGGVWILNALLIAFVPAFVTGVVARLAFKMNFYEICGLLTGATTNTYALDFCRENYGSDHAAVGFATVYPVALFLQVLAAQVLILISCA